MTESNVEMIEVNDVKDFSEDNFTKINKDIEALKIDDDIRALQELNDKVIVLESYKNVLLKNKACSQDDVINLISLGISQESLPNLKSFTKNRSPINFDNLLTDVKGKLIKLGKKIIALIKKLIDKTLSFLSRSFDKQNALSKNLMVLRKNSDKFINGINKYSTTKPFFDNMATLNHADIEAVKEKISSFYNTVGIGSTSLSDIGGKSLMSLLEGIADKVIQYKGNGLVADTVGEKKYIPLLEDFTSIDLTPFISEFNTFINTEITDKPLTREYRTNLNFFASSKLNTMSKEEVTSFCSIVSALALTKPVPDLSSCTFKDKTGLFFLDVFSQDIFKRSYNRKSLEEASKLMQSRYNTNASGLEGEMHPEYHETITRFYLSLHSFIELTKLVETYNSGLITLTVNMSKTIEFQTGLVNYLNSKY